MIRTPIVAYFTLSISPPASALMHDFLTCAGLQHAFLNWRGINSADA